MIARTLRGLGALALIGLALIGWPAALLGLTDAVAVWLPDLSDPAALLSRPDTGGLFLVIVLALGWAAWVVWTVALIVEVVAQVRGVPTPRLGGLFPQNATAALVTAIAVAFTIAPTAPAIAGTAGAEPPASAGASQTVADRHTAAQLQATTVTSPTGSDDSAGTTDQAEQGDYTVVRGDTLWDIADEQLDDPTRYPEIVQASEAITQPDGRHLADPDLILPGWTLNIPDQADSGEAAPAVDEPAAEADPGPVPGPAAPGDSPTQDEQVVPPTTPMQSPSPEGQQDTATLAAGGDLPPTQSASRPADRARPGGGPGRAAAAAMGPATPALPATPMSGTGDQLPDTPVREAVYDDEGRFAPNHGVLGLPNWITYPQIPTPAEDAPELVAAATASLASRAAASAADPVRSADVQSSRPPQDRPDR